jgi:hypothetical protein
MCLQYLESPEWKTLDQKFKQHQIPDQITNPLELKPLLQPKDVEFQKKIEKKDDDKKVPDQSGKIKQKLLSKVSINQEITSEQREDDDDKTKTEEPGYQSISTIVIYSNHILNMHQKIVI